MNFNTVKLGFEEYLIQQGKLEPKELRKGSDEDISILSNAKEFKEYLNKTYSIDSSQIQYDSIDSILKFLNNEAQNQEGQDGQEENELSEDDKFLQEMLDDLMQDEKFIDVVDSDENAEISEEELSSFLDYVKENSEDSETLTLEDILTAAEEIQSGEFTYGESEFTQEDIEQIEGDMQDEFSPSVSFEPSGTPQATSTTRGYTAGGATGSAGYTPASKQSTNPLDNMTAEQLKQEKETRQTNLNNSKTNLEKVTQDSEKSVDEAYKSYTDEMAKIDEESAEVADKLQGAYDKISGFEKEIDNQNNIISGLKADLNTAKSKETTANTKISDLENQLSYLQSSSSEKNNLQEQIDKVNSALESAKKEKEDAIKEQDDINTKIKEAQDVIQQQEEEIEAVNKEIEEFKAKEAEILEKNTELQQYKSAYEQAKTDKETNIEKAQNEVSKAQGELDEVEAKINIQQYQEDKKEYISGYYNVDAGAKLAQQALNVDGTVGLCLGGVSKTLKATYGEGIPLGSAYMAADYLRGNMAGSEGLASHFVEVQVDRSELANLPAGAIVVWDNNQNGGGSNVSAAGRKHGHISIALGDGRESSDHIQNQIVNRDANFTVFYPVS